MNSPNIFTNCVSQIKNEPDFTKAAVILMSFCEKTQKGVAAICAAAALFIGLVIGVMIGGAIS